MFYFDRMYGQMIFPPLVRRVLDCPGLLRLREVRMANIPFLSFPSFTGVTRYEHSLGVCHLAQIFADANSLSEKDRIEVMLAALYHDAATPPFGHAVEEVLSALYGYDHEEKLREIIIGTTSDPGGQRAQLFLGRSIKLHKVCQSQRGRELGLDVLRIADLAAGTSEDVLGDVICSSGVDLDNIDNVIRAATAMGIREYEPTVAENLARSLVLDKNIVCLDEAALKLLESWQTARNLLYGMIYASLEDFALQTMLKHALRKLATATQNQALEEADWSLTDDQLTHERLLCNPITAPIVFRMRVAEIYTCLAYLYLEPTGSDAPKHLPLDEIECIASTVFDDYIQRTLSPTKRKFPSPEIIANAYPEKRFRSPERPTCFMGRRRMQQTEPGPQNWVLGVFTPYHRRWDQEAEQAFRQSIPQTYRITRIHRVHKRLGTYPTIEECKL